MKGNNIMISNTNCFNYVIKRFIVLRRHREIKKSTKFIEDNSKNK